MEKELMEQFNLPSYVKGKTFAAASKIINDKFKDRTDKVSSETKNEMLTRLSQAQEYIKMQEAMKTQSQEVPDMMNGEIPEGMNEFFNGGQIDPVTGRPMVTQANAGMNAVGPQQMSGGAEIATAGVPEGADAAGATQAGGGPGAGAYVGAASAALDLGKTAFGPSGIDTAGYTRGPDVSVGGATASGAMKGASAGASFGPWGAAIGGVVGGAAGFMGGKKAQKDASEATNNFDLTQSNLLRNSYAMGGPTDPPTKKKFVAMPATPWTSNPDDMNIAEANAKGLDGAQLSGFESQDASDHDWRKKRDTYYGDYFKNWRSQGTNDKLSQSSPEYMKMKQDMKNSWFENNQRPINDVVQDYRANGPAKPVEAITASPNRGELFSVPTQSTVADLGNDFAAGGVMRKKRLRPSATNDYPKGGPLGLKSTADELVGFENTNFRKAANLFGDTPTFNESFNMPNIDPKLNTIDTSGTLGSIQQQLAGRSGTDPKSDFGKKVGKTLGAGADWMGDNYGSLMRYAPVLGNALNKITPAETQVGERLGNVYKERNLDERSLLNEINQNNTAAALKEGSRGSAGNLQANLQADGINRTKAIGTAMNQDTQSKRQEGQFKHQSDMQRDSTNVQLNERYLDRKAQDEGAYNTAKQAQRNALFEDVGKIGKEEVNKKMVKEMFGYTWNGKYFVDKKGNKHSEEDVMTDIKSKNKKDKK